MLKLNSNDLLEKAKFEITKQMIEVGFVDYSDGASFLQELSWDIVSNHLEGIRGELSDAFEEELNSYMHESYEKSGECDDNGKYTGCFYKDQEGLENWNNACNPLEIKEDEDMKTTNRQERVFLIVTNEGRVLQKVYRSEVLDTDQVVYNLDIDNLVEIEMDPACHSDSIDDYDSPLDFYLSNAIQEDYTEFIKLTFPLTPQALDLIKKEVIFQISERVKPNS